MDKSRQSRYLATKTDRNSVRDIDNVIIQALTDKKNNIMPIGYLNSVA